MLADPRAAALGRRFAAPWFRLLVPTGSSTRSGWSRRLRRHREVAPEINGDRFRSSAGFRIQADRKQTQRSDLFVSTSLDQPYARRFGQSTAMPSMQLCIENLDQAGGCTCNYSCAYTDSICWSPPNEPLR